MALISNLFFLAFQLWNINHSYAYDWQKHIPQIAAKNSITGVSSLTGRITTSNHYGPLVLNQAEVESSLSVFGPLNAKETNFKGDLTCHGPVALNGNKNTLQGTVQIRGPLIVNGSIFKGPVTIFGYINAHNCFFKKSIIIHTSKVELKNTQIDNLIVEDKENNPVEIILDNVELNGKITIASGYGTVFIKNSHIPQGKISGYKKITQN